MASSMTGFGRGQVVHDDRKCNVEIKSVNSKYCDIQIKSPRILNALENRVRDSITKALHRGKIDVFINYEDNRDESKIVTVDLPLVKAYQKALEEISETIGLQEKITVSLIARQNDVLQTQLAQLDEDETWSILSIALDTAIDSICIMREKEGAALVINVLEKCETIESLRRQILNRAPLVLSEYRTRLQQRISKLMEEVPKGVIDEQRLAMEVAIYADKCAIDEELVRLESHITQLKSTLKETQSVGKKADFILQEMNREINTIGSKANDLVITKCVVGLKAQLETIREQIQNIE